jgi:hypothetical protein
VLIAVGIAFGLAQGDSANTAAFIASVSGVIVEFISGVFFVLYNRTVRQLKEYHDSLLNVQNILLALKVVEDSGHQNRRSRRSRLPCPSPSPVRI